MKFAGIDTVLVQDDHDILHSGIQGTFIFLSDSFITAQYLSHYISAMSMTVDMQDFSSRVKLNLSRCPLMPGIYGIQL